MGPGGGMSNLASVPKSLGQGFALLESEASTHRELARARSLLRGAQERNQAQPEAAVRLAAWRDALQELAAPKAAGPR